MLRSASSNDFHHVRPTHMQVRSTAMDPQSSINSNSNTSAALGIHPKWYTQLILLGLTLICCGGIVGLSRLLPQLAEERFHQKSYSAVLLFICFFGLFKAIFNLLVGTLAESFGRRVLLLSGWALSYLTPLVIWCALAWEGSWNWIIFATALLGASQGLCTSTVVIMVMDIIPQRARGISMGVLECTIYVSLGACALIANELVAKFHDFRAVLLVHFALCTIGLLASLRARETQSVPMDRIIHSGGLDDEDVVEHADDEEDSRPSKHDQHDRDAIGMERRSEPPRMATFPVAHEATSSAAATAASLQWKSLLQGDPSSSEASSPTAPSTVVAPSADLSSSSSSKKSILPVLSIHSIPASPFPDFPSTTHSAHNGSQAHAFLAGKDALNGAANGLGWDGVNPPPSIAGTASSNASVGREPASPNPDVDGGDHSRSNSSSSLSRLSTSLSPRKPKLLSPGPGGPGQAEEMLHGRRPSLSGSSSNEDLALLRGARDSDTTSSRGHPPPPLHAHYSAPESFCGAFRSSLKRTFSSAILRAIVQAGFFNNFKDGVLWGVLPSFFSSLHHTSLSQLGYLLTAYPLVWGVGQLVTGRLSDQMGRGRFIVIGLGLQGVGIVGLVGTPSFVAWMGGVLGVGGSVPQTAAGTIKNASSAVVLTATVLDDARFFVWLGQLIGIGFGTALSYPVLQAYIGDVVPAHHRASTIGVYRLCRDLGYAIGGLLSGYVADVYGVEQCLEMMAVLLLLSALWAFLALPKDEVEGWMTSAGGTKKEGRAERD